MDKVKFGKTLDQIIVIHQDITIRVNDMVVFPHGYDGYHLWEAGIVLTRYLYHFQNQTFNGKSVLELGTGVGITGIYLSKYSGVSMVVMTDYQGDILRNAEKNALKNINSKQNWKMLNLDWNNYQKYDQQFDYIVGADLIYSGAPLESLYQTSKKLLRKGGVFFLLVPTQRQEAKNFLLIVEKDQCFSVDSVLLDQNFIYQSALIDQKQSDQNYPGLKELKFYIYLLTKL